MFKFETQNADGIIYYNGTLTNELQTTYNTIQAGFLQTLDQVLVSNPKLYDLAITRFTISSQAIPMWIVPVQLNQPNVNLTPYSIQLSYSSPSGNTSSTGDIYLVWSNEISEPYLNGENIKVQPLDSGYYFSYNRQDFVSMFNNAMENALNTLMTIFITQHPLDPNPPALITQFNGNQPNPLFPFLSWNSSLNKFQMYFNLTVFSGANPIKVFVNNLLFPLIQFPSANKFYNRPVDVPFAYQIDISKDDNYYTPTFYNAFPDIPKYPFVVVYSDHDTTGVFSPLRSIMISSNTLPTQGEIMQPSTSPFSIANPSSTNQPSSIKIVSDFEPDLFSTNQINRDFIQYNQSINNSRLISFQNYNVAIKQIDVAVYWSDWNNNVYPIYLYAGCSFDIKLALVPKSYVRSDN
jgi:hypothetical protein